MSESLGFISNRQADQTAIRIEDRRRFQDFRVETALLKSNLSIYERMVYVVLCSFASREGECFPSLETVSSGAGCSVRQVQRALVALEEKGIIRRLANFRPGDMRQTANVYHILGFPKGSGEGEPKEKRQAGSPVSGGRVTNSHPPGDCQSPQEVIPSEVREKETDTLYPAAPAAEKGGQRPLPEGRICDTPNPYTKGIPYREKPEVTRDQVPLAFRETYDLFLLKTGRKGITRAELGYIEALEKLHIPARVQVEITNALDRFRNPKRQGAHPRGPSELNWYYIWDALKSQKSGKAHRQAKLRPTGGRRIDPKWLKQLEAWEKGT